MIKINICAIKNEELNDKVVTKNYYFIDIKKKDFIDLLKNKYPDVDYFYPYYYFVKGEYKFFIEIVDVIPIPAENLFSWIDNLNS